MNSDTDETARTAPAASHESGIRHEAGEKTSGIRLASGRRAIVTISLGVIVAALVVASLTLGSYALAPADLVATLFGHGSPADALVVWRLRMPRILLGALVGVAFGVSGAIFQTLLRNPLASPDIIGISGGASAAAAFGILVLGVSGPVVSAIAFGGAMLVALAIYLLAWRGGVSGFRFVLIGVGFAFVAQAVVGYLISRGDEREVSAALAWTVGGLGGAEWQGISVVAVALVVLLPLVAILAQRLRMLQLGDESAAGLGVPVERSRLLLLVVAVALAAVATAFAGPIAFVAFVSAPIARRMLRDGSLALPQSALVGILIVLFADLTAQNLLSAATQVPAGIVTGIIGAPYLVWLLVTSSGRRTT
ncbi:iron chelate uptake ABC transporter family permease subunit [Okibacterium endophyticum]